MRSLRDMLSLVAGYVLLALLLGVCAHWAAHSVASPLHQIERVLEGR
jgi:hypothetical protein